LSKGRIPACYILNNPSVPFSGGLGVGQSPAKPVSQYKLVGTRPGEISIPSIVVGTLTYIQNVRLPGMLHGRIVRPRGQAVYGFGAPVVSVDESSIAHLPDVKVVRVGNFLGVVAKHEYDAIQAAAQLKVTWGDPPEALPGNGNQVEAMRALDAAGKTVWVRNDTDNGEAGASWGEQTLNQGDVGSALASAAHVVSGSFSWPSNLHAPLGPACAVADVTAQGARILLGCQGAYSVQSTVAKVLALPLNQVRVTAFPMGGTFGSSPYVDSAVSAALMSKAVGAPVRVQFMRWDDIGWGNTGPGGLIDVRAGIDSTGKLAAFDFTHYYPQYISGRPSNELAVLSQPTSSPSGQYYTARMYDIPNRNYLVKSIPLVNNWVKSVWMRHGSGPQTTFAGEQVIDELAHAAGMDPVAFRVQNVTQGVAKPFLLSVLNAVTQAANWQPKVAAAQLSGTNVVSGRGVAWSYSESTRGAATIADIEVNKKTGKVVVKHVFEAFSPGVVINPALIENQISGGITQIVSRLLVEEMRFDKTHVTSSDFVTYPILRFKDTPQVTTIAVSNLNDDAFGAGEPVTVPTAAAIANAFFDATGVRMRTVPFTPVRVRATLKAAGVA
jgi:nicotinate dehydrogenase subunit B